MLEFPEVSIMARQLTETVSGSVVADVRLVGKKDAPKEYQLLLLLEDGRALAFTVAMYGGIVLHGREYDEPYYLKSRNAVPPSAPGFAAYFEAAFNACKPSLSVKAFWRRNSVSPGWATAYCRIFCLPRGFTRSAKRGL